MSIYLVEIDGYNPATAAVETLRYATRAYISRPTDTPANARYLPRLATALNLEQSMYSQGTTGGASEVGVGAVEMANTDGALDGLLDFGFAGRAVRVYSIVGAKSSLASRELVFRGTVEQPEFSLERVTFRVRDRLAELDKPVCANRYRGDNDPEAEPIGIEGSADIAGQLKPVVLGYCRNVPAVQVCPQKLIFQAHDGPSKAIGSVYDSGAKLSGNVFTPGDFANEDLWPTLGDWRIVDNNLCIEPGWQTGTQDAYSSPFVMIHGVRYRMTIVVKRDDGYTGYVDWMYTAGSSGYDYLARRMYDGTYMYDFILSGPDGSVDGDVIIAQLNLYYYSSFSIPLNSFVGRVENVTIEPVAIDYPDIASLEAAMVIPGSYATCLAEGLIRLGASPAGEVTADLNGGASGPNLVANGFFDDASAWVADAGWVIHPEYHFAAKPDGNVTPVDLSQDIPIVAGVTYQIRIICRLNSETYFKAGVGGAWGPSVDTAGVYMATVTAINTDGLIIRGEPGFGFTVSAIEVRRIFRGGWDQFSAHTPANILRILALGYGRMLDADLDEDSLTAMLALNLPYVGHLVADDATTVIEAMDAIAGSVGAWWTIAPDGRLRVGRLALPSGTPLAELTLGSESLESGGIERLATGDAGRGVPCWKANVDYQRNWTVQTSSLSTDQVFAQSSVAGVVSDERRAWLNAEYRTASAEDATVRTKYPDAPEMRVETGLDIAADAQTEAARLLALFGTRRDRFRIRVPAAKARGLGLGDVIRVTFPRFGLAAGKLFTVIGRTDVLSGDQDTTDLDIWG